MRIRRSPPRPNRGRRLKRGIYVLPSILTLGNVYFGFAAIMTLVNHLGAPDFPRYCQRAALMLLGAAFLDTMDGKVAKLTHTTSEFGLQLDSLADVISFGLAPGVLAYSWALQGHHRAGWLPAFLFLMCGALRLARFNVQADTDGRGDFEGLPIPGGAMAIVALVLLKPVVVQKSPFSYFVIFLLYALSFLMVSRVRYRSFKDFDFKLLRPFRTILLLGLLLIVIMHDPRTMFFLMAFGFILSGPLGRVIPMDRLPTLRRVAHGFLATVADDDVEDPPGDGVEFIEEGES